MGIDKKIKGKYNGEYERVSDYIGYDKDITLKHKVCGNSYITNLHTFLRKDNSGRCSFCFSSKNITEEEFKVESKTISWK